MSHSLTLPDDLFDHLRRTANQQGVSIEQLLREWLIKRVSAGEGPSSLQDDDELLMACTRALLEGGEPPITADWEELMTTLEHSEPVPPTVDEAMSVLRHRPWTKDS
jgi:hypothetical protein